MGTRRTRTPVTASNAPQGSSSPSPLAAVSQLMAERAKYEKWLQELDAKSESRPAHVVERVRSDYQSRLQVVLDRLQEHAGALQTHASGLVAQLRKLEDEEQRVRDEAVESELRAQVGEISDAEWQLVSKKAERELAKLKEDQDLIATDLNRIRELLGQPTPTEPSRRSADFDELEFLKSVVGSTTPAGSATSPNAARAAEPAPQREPETQTATTAAASPKTPPSAPAAPAAATSVQAAAPSASTAAASAASPTPAAAPAPAAPREPAPKPAGAEPPLAAHVTGSNPLVLRTSGVVEQPKTLKCAECGAMNYPNEWYCERCGAELAAI